MQSRLVSPTYYIYKQMCRNKLTITFSIVCFNCLSPKRKYICFKSKNHSWLGLKYPLTHHRCRPSYNIRALHNNFELSSQLFFPLNSYMCTQPKQTTLDGWCDREDPRKLASLLSLFRREEANHSIIMSVDNSSKRTNVHQKPWKNNKYVN